MHDSLPPHDEPLAPQALDAAGAASLSALGAIAPLDNVVSLDTARRAGSDDASESSGGAGASPSAPPPPSKSASARSVGEGAKRAGAGKAEDKPKKPEKTIDWGVHNYLVENFVLIYPTDTAWDSAKRKVVKISNMAHMYGSDMVRMWKSSAKRRSIDEDDLVFDPTLSCDPDSSINLFDGMPMKPRACTEADVAVMLELLRHLCSRCATKGVTIDEVMRWVLCWLALPLQQPGAKPRTALVFHGPQGTGKNLFFDAVRAIYGKYGVMVGQTQLEEKYNGWLSAKLLILGNEVVSRQELYHNKNQLKWVISEEEIPIRTMQTDTRWERNHANVVFLSNESKPLVLEVDDRRYLVVYTPVGEDGDLYLRVRDFLADDGSARFMHYLLHYDLGDFHEHTKPLMTEAKADLIELSMRPEERFVHEWVEGYLDLPMQVCSAEQLYRAFRRWVDVNGEKWGVPNQSSFTKNVERWATQRGDRDEEGKRREPCLVYKVVNVKDATAARKAQRCWLPRGTGPRDGVSLGEWAGEAIEKFEKALYRFLRPRGGHNEGDVAHDA